MASDKRRLPLIKESDLGLCTDLYQLTMAAGYFENGIEHTSTFELFVRGFPPKRSYLLAAGLEQAIEYFETMHFDDDAIAYLRSHPAFGNVSKGFFDCLRTLRFTGDVHAVPEGTVVFPDEPILRITAPVMEAQIVETYLLTTINFETLIATKASRVAAAARGKPVADFGTRRAHGPQAGLWAARACFIGGCTATSNVLAGSVFGIPVVGTAAHSWTMAVDSEEEAFRRYQEVFPDNTILLIDTYDTLEGARRVVELGLPVQGVRLDSGDLAALSRKVRKILDECGLTETKIVASGDLNEYRIDELLTGGAPIDLFGVGTEMVTSKDAPALAGVYKLVEQKEDGRVVPKLKTSAEKETYPGAKQVFRQTDSEGTFQRDILTTSDDPRAGIPLIQEVMREGKRLDDPLPLDVIQKEAKAQLARLDERYRRLEPEAAYPVEVSESLRKLTDETRRAICE